MNQTVIKAFDVLAYVVDNPRKQSLNQMARVLGMNKTTLFRFLSTLEAIAILDRRGDIYVPGIKLFELGSKVPVKQLIVDKIHPFLVRLAAEVNETVNLGELNGSRVLYLDKIESQRRLRIHTSVGGTTALHATGMGKSILSILPDSLRDTLIGKLDFEKRTARTITEPQLLREHIQTVIENGFSTDCEEFEPGLHCVAVPLLIESLHFYGAVSCSGPSVLFTPQRAEELAGKLKRTVNEIKDIFNYHKENIETQEVDDDQDL
jgi:IclR family KDG regulon transcriptional repressor